MSTKVPAAYQVPGYNEVNDLATAISKLNVGNKQAIRDKVLNDEEITGVRNEARMKRREQVSDHESYSNLKTKQTLGDMTPEDLQTLKELRSKLELGLTPKIFEGTVQDKLTSGMSEGIINFNGKKYTFVRREGIPKSFEQMGVEVKDCADWKEATVYLKEFFADYADQYPELFATEDWYSVNNTKMFPMINQRAQDHNIPYAGLQCPSGGHDGVGADLYAWLPVRVAGKFAYFWSNSAGEEALFDCGGEGYAHLAVSFMN